MWRNHIEKWINRFRLIMCGSVGFFLHKSQPSHKRLYKRDLQGFFTNRIQTKFMSLTSPHMMSPYIPFPHRKGHQFTINCYPLSNETQNDFQKMCSNQISEPINDLSRPTHPCSNELFLKSPTAVFFFSK